MQMYVVSCINIFYLVSSERREDIHIYIFMTHIHIFCLICIYMYTYTCICMRKRVDFCHTYMCLLSCVCSLLHIYVCTCICTHKTADFWPTHIHVHIWPIYIYLRTRGGIFQADPQFCLDVSHYHIRKCSCMSVGI